MKKKLYIFTTFAVALFVATFAFVPAAYAETVIVEAPELVVADGSDEIGEAYAGEAAAAEAESTGEAGSANAADVTDEATLELTSIADPGYPRTGKVNYDQASAVLKLVNQQRQANGKALLVMDKDLQSAAMQRAAEISLMFSHTRPDGRACFTISSKLAGENIAAGQTDAQAVMNSWMNSSGHKENILNASYKTIGVGCFVWNGFTYWVQCFGTQGTEGYAGSGVHDQQFYIPIAYAEGLTENENLMYRLYNRYTGEHFYTAAPGERNSLINAGWTYEGIGWVAPTKSNTPVYRLYNKYAPGGDHHYTTNKTEYDALVKRGWTGEGVAWYSDDAKATALYRQYNPYAATGTHNYTANTKEKDQLIKLGWRDEGVAWYSLSFTSN